MIVIVLKTRQKTLGLQGNPKVVSRAIPGGSVVKNSPANAGDIRDTGQEDPQEEEMATHSSILAWEIP